MHYVALALLAALLLSLTDTCQKYALDHGVTSLQYTAWSHGAVYVACAAGLVAVVALGGRTWLAKLLTHAGGGGGGGRAGSVAAPGSGSLTELLRLPAAHSVRAAVIASGLFAFATVVVIALAFQRCHNAGYAVAIVSSTGLITMLIAWLAFGKRLDTRALLGGMLVVLGLGFVASCENVSTLDR